MNDTRELAIYVLRWLDRNNLGDTDLREIMDSVGNYNCSLEKAITMWVIESKCPAPCCEEELKSI